MILWLIFALMTAGAALTVLWPLSQDAALQPDLDSDKAFYKAQLQEIARNQARGLLEPDTAEQARIEAARRLLRVSGEVSSSVSIGEPALRRRKVASALALSIIPLLTLLIYGSFGSPDLPSLPHQTRTSAKPEQMDISTALVRIESQLAKAPDDLKGWRVLVPIYRQMGRYQDAANALKQVMRLSGETADLLVDFADMQIAFEQGVVSAEARSSVEKAVALDSKHIRAQLLMARFYEQEKNSIKAVEIYKALKAQTSDAPFLQQMLEKRIQELETVEGIK